MSSADDNEMTALEQQRAISIVSTMVPLGAAVFLGGGFYYGLVKQKKALVEEEKNLGKIPSSKKEFKPKSATFFERKLALDKPLPPGTAASKALLGVTVVSVAGCCLLVGGAAAALGVTNFTELRQRLQHTPRSHTISTSSHLDLPESREARKDYTDVKVEEQNKPASE